VICSWATPTIRSRAGLTCREFDQLIKNEINGYRLKLLSSSAYELREYSVTQPLRNIVWLARSSTDPLLLLKCASFVWSHFVYHYYSVFSTSMRFKPLDDFFASFSLNDAPTKRQQHHLLFEGPEDPAWAVLWPGDEDFFLKTFLSPHVAPQFFASFLRSEVKEDKEVFPFIATLLVACHEVNPNVAVDTFVLGKVSPEIPTLILDWFAKYTQDRITPKNGILASLRWLLAVPMCPEFVALCEPSIVIIEQMQMHLSTTVYLSAFNFLQKTELPVED